MSPGSKQSEFVFTDTLGEGAESTVGCLGTAMFKNNQWHAAISLSSLHGPVKVEARASTRQAAIMAALKLWSETYFERTDS